MVDSPLTPSDLLQCIMLTYSLLSFEQIDLVNVRLADKHTGMFLLVTQNAKRFEFCGICVVLVSSVVGVEGSFEAAYINAAALTFTRPAS